MNMHPPPHTQVVSTAITTELYCPPGQQQQDIGSEGGEKACFACPVGTYQPLRSKAPCQPCPFGAAFTYMHV